MALDGAVATSSTRPLVPVPSSQTAGLYIFPTVYGHTVVGPTNVLQVLQQPVSSVLPVYSVLLNVLRVFHVFSVLSVLRVFRVLCVLHVLPVLRVLRPPPNAGLEDGPFRLPGQPGRAPPTCLQVKLYIPSTSPSAIYPNPIQY